MVLAGSLSCVAAGSADCCACELPASWLLLTTPRVCAALVRAGDALCLGNGAPGNMILVYVACIRADCHELTVILLQEGAAVACAEAQRCAYSYRHTRMVYIVYRDQPHYPTL